MMKSSPWLTPHLIDIAPTRKKNWATLTNADTMSQYLEKKEKLDVNRSLQIC